MTVPLAAAPPFTGGWNEAFVAPGRLRPLYDSLLRAIEPVDMESLAVAVAGWIEARQATFGGDPLAEGYEPELRGRWQGRSAPLGVVGLDVVRDRDGELSALEDNARTPSGFAYAVVARDAVTATLDDLAPAVGSTTPPPALEPAIEDTWVLT
jgi:uncharacterized circularly permuted ATP-grasp superfamily protein